MCLLMNFGDLVRAVRVARGLTQAGLAALVGCSQQKVANIEGGYRPSEAEIAAFAHALGVPREALTGGASVELFARNPHSTVEPFALVEA